MNIQNDDIGFETRLKHIQQYIIEKNLAAMLLSSPVSIGYFTGYRGVSDNEIESILLVTAKTITLVIPKMYQNQAGKLPKNVNPVVNAAGISLIECALESGKIDGTIGLEFGHLSYALVKKYFEKWSKTESVDEFISQMRSVKDASEVALLKDVIAKTDHVWADFVSYLRSTDYSILSELDCQDKLRSLGRSYELPGFSFEAIVACGASSAQPHYVSQTKKLSRGMPLLVDFGFKKAGYCSDMTRMVFLGKPTAEYSKRYNLVLTANLLGIDKIEAGTVASCVHEEIVLLFKRDGVDSYFLHSLGHGLGTEVHESPFLAPNQATILQPGHVVTVEPGLYFEGEYGIRIEDDVLVTTEGKTVLSQSSKTLEFIA